MKKIAIIIIIALAFPFGLKAQQAPMFTQYMNYSYVINPAVAGTFNYYQVRLNSRLQWLSMADSPITNVLSTYGPFVNRSMGWGAYVYSDVTGPISNTGIFGSYAYNMPINDAIKFSAGLSAGIYQYRIDGSSINFQDQEDPYNNSSMDNRYVPDANIGLYLYSSNFHVGFATHQLVNAKIRPYKNVVSDTTSLYGRMKSHFYLHGAYKYFINREFAVEPTMMIKAVGASPIQLDIGATVIYRNMVWGGLSFRTLDALSILLGYAYENKIYIAYSYDIGVSDFRTIKHGGSHELMIAYKFNPIKD